jgi:hypothetical protein
MAVLQEVLIGARVLSRTRNRRLPVLLALAVAVVVLLFHTETVLQPAPQTEPTSPSLQVLGRTDFAVRTWSTAMVTSPAPTPILTVLVAVRIDFAVVEFGAPQSACCGCAPACGAN